MKSSSKRQRGGTILGLIIGLVLGLGLALGVAVYVTKVPVPFINKGATRNVEQDAVEAKKNRDWDPNGLIQGKSAMRSSGGNVTDSASDKDAKGEAADAAKAKAAAKTDAKPDAKPDTKSDTKSDTKVEAKTEAKAEPKAEPKKEVAKPSADPLGDLARAKAAVPTSSEPFTYMVQTGAFKGSDEAESQRAKLALSGIEVKVSEREQSGRTVYRVRSGPYERREDAEKAKEKLETSGYDAVIVRVQR